MPEEYDNDLLKQGILNFKTKDYALARRYFERALDMADDLQTRAQANYFLSQVVDDPGQKRQYLEETLSIDMGHAAARRALAILDGKLDPHAIVNPDSLPAPLSGTQTAQADRFTCPKCGGHMLYTPDGSSLVCENCSRQQMLKPLAAGSEQDFFVAMANGKGFRKSISMKTFQCQGCGANFLLRPSELSVACAYCGAVHVISMDKEMELVEPNSVIPMTLDQEQAHVQLLHWLEKNHLQPRGRVDPPRGLYLPVWVFDLIGTIPWSGRVMRDKRELPVSGESPATFNNVCIPASRKLASLLPELLPGYKLASAPDYDPRYLAGWPAEVYDTTMSDAALEARHICVEKIRREITAEQGNVIDLRYSASAISITSYRLILLPVWVAEYPFENRTHRVFINGQTGSVHGEIPSQGLKSLLKDLLRS
jgi:hypothetical protein